IAASRSSTATPMWSILPNIGRSVPSRPVRIALTANRESGGGLDPGPLLTAMRAAGAEPQLFGCEPHELERVAAWNPDRVAVAGERMRALELGRLADGRPFVNVASAGLASKAARHAHAFKRALGPLAYGVGALRAAATESPLHCSVRVDGEEAFEGGAWQVIVAATGAFGAGSDVGVADPLDGVLDVAILSAGSRLALARRAWGLRRGTIVSQ